MGVFFFFCPFLSTLINSIHVNHVFNGLTHTNRCGATWSSFQCRLPPKLPQALRFHFINLSTLFERVRDFIHLRCLCVWLLAGNWLISWLIFECKYWSSTCLSFNSIIRYYISLFWGWGTTLWFRIRELPPNNLMVTFKKLQLTILNYFNE